MKRVAVFALLCLLVLTPHVAYADVVMGNEFYYRNMDKTEPIGEWRRGKRFTINSPQGYVIPKVVPGSDAGVPSGVGYRSGGYPCFLPCASTCKMVA